MIFIVIPATTECLITVICLSVFRLWIDICQSAQNIAHCCCIPCIRVMVVRTLAILRVTLSRIGRRNKHFILWQGICYCGCSHSFASKLKNASDNRSGYFINIQRLLILRLSVISIRHSTTDTFSVSHSSLKYRLNLLTGVFCIPWLSGLCQSTGNPWNHLSDDCQSSASQNTF